MATTGELPTDIAALPLTWRDTLYAYYRLTKPMIIVLLLITTLCAMFIAQAGVPPLHIIALTMLGGALSAGGANALNSYLERDLDKHMFRTSRRPMPRHAIPPAHARAFAIGLGVAATLIFGFGLNWLSAALSAAGYLTYIFVYTLWLKRRSMQNIVIGGIAGAFPPLVGYAAVTGSLDLLAFYLFAIIFWWTPPHTWALALLVSDDYARAGIPMLPVAVGPKETVRHIFWYSALLVIVTLLPLLGTQAGPIYAVTMGVLNFWHLKLAWQLLQNPDKATARKLYKYSQLYLTLLFVGLVIDRLV